MKGPVKAGTDVNQANLGTFTRADGTVQATFFGHQLYFFSQDTSPGQANGQGGDGGRFFLVDRTGNAITS